MSAQGFPRENPPAYDFIWPFYTLVITLAVALGIVVTMGFLCFRVGPTVPQDHYINLAILLANLAVGWLLGTFVSPDSPDEETRFSRYGTAIKAFAHGIPGFQV